MEKFYHERKNKRTSGLPGWNNAELDRRQMEGFDFNSVKDSNTKTQSDYNLEDLLDLEDLQ